MHLRSSFSVRCVLVVLALCVSGRPSVAAELDVDRPNILLILADDLAWSDCGFQGHPWHQTLNIDRLAASGVVFTNAYAPAPICSASRASILTGKTPARLNFEFVTKNEPGRQQLDAVTKLRAPPFTLNLPLAEVTFAERLHSAGYSTAFFGKWHLNAHHGGYLGWSPEFGPAAQGFDAAVDDFGAHPYAWRKQSVEPIKTVGQYPDDSLINGVCEYLQNPPATPFLAMASLYHVHTPVRTPCSWLLDKYDRRVANEAERRDNRIRYAAFVETLDHHVGQILTALEQSGQADNTLVVFTSDNGGHPEYAANGPLRGSKWNLYEGGIRVPFIVRWPDRLPAGTTSDRPVTGFDLWSTFATLAENAPSQNVDADGISLLQGEDFQLRPNEQPPRELIWHFPYYHPERGYKDSPDEIGVDDFQTSRTKPHSAIRMGRHKLLYFYEDNRVELYDLHTDIAEQTDLSHQEPELVDDLKRRLHRRLNEMDARRPERATQ